MQHVSSHFNVLPIIISQYLYYSTKCAVLRNWAVAFIHAKEGTQAATFPRFQQWLLGGVRVVHFGRCRSLFYSFKFVSTRTFPVGKEGADNPPTMGAETADHTLQFGHDLLLSLPLSLSLSLPARFKLSLFTTTSYYYTLLLLLMKSSGLQTSSSLIRSYYAVSLPCRLPLCPKISAPLSNQTLVSRQISSGLVLGKEVINYHITRLLY